MSRYGLTTKGDLIAYTGTGAERVGVGSDGQVLTASAAASGGVAWTTLPSTNLTDILVQGGAPIGVLGIDEADTFPVTLPMQTVGGVGAGDGNITTPNAGNAVFGTNASGTRVYQVTAVCYLELVADAVRAGELIRLLVQMNHSAGGYDYEHELSIDIPSGTNDLYKFELTGTFELTSAQTVLVQLATPAVAPAEWDVNARVSEWNVKDLGAGPLA